MKTIKLYIVIITSGLLTLLSCQKESGADYESNGDGTISVKIVLSYPDSKVGTKAIGERLDDATTIDFDRGHLLFVDDRNIVHRHISIGTTYGSRGITKEELESGSAIIDGVSTLATKCIVLLNDVATGNGREITLLEDNLTGSYRTLGSYRISNINSDDGGVSLIPLVGEGVLTEVDGEELYQATVHVDTKAAFSRYQIGRISADSYSYKDELEQDQTITINSFEVQGIYINNFYDAYSITHGIFPHYLVDNGSNILYYSSDYMPGRYIEYYWGERMHDQINREAVAPSLTIYPDEADMSKVWAYNLFPTVGEGIIPHVVIRFKNIKFSDSRVAGEQTLEDYFITVEKLRYAAGHPKAGQQIEEIEPNNIYTISDLRFNYSHLTNMPYHQGVEATVTVTLFNWIDHEIDWSY